jgi:predicted dehydrogenase/threonine dehydrogenase-like Zn-dependent dehydrogenase
MKQLLQDLSNGKTCLIDAPAPNAATGSLLINSMVSLVSAGTERMVVDFGKAGFIGKARQQPEKVKMVLEKAKTDGLITTFDAVRSKLAQPIPLGYSNVGVVAETGAGIEGFKPGDRIVSNGRHADVVCVPVNLCAKIPDNVDNDTAAFTIVSSIGLQGIRLARPEIGESFAVIGVGLIGLLVVQMLRAHGCRVLAIDVDDAKLDLARKFGAHTCNPGNGEDPVAAGMAFSRGKGIDGVLICAATKSTDPVIQAARMSRKWGRIILVGVTGLELNRSDFYEKELTFQVSCSYGPGRYDPEYEDKGNDYPFGFVRWTEQRNFEAVLDMMSEGKIVVNSLISHRFDFEEAAKAYDTLSKEKSVLGILLQYGDENKSRHYKSLQLSAISKFKAEKPVLAFIGAGNYASRVLIPAFKDCGAQLHSIVTSGGTSGAFHGEKFGFAYASTTLEAVLSSGDINTLVVVTRHNSHAGLVVKALSAGKNVFVEKPLAISEEELNDVEQAYTSVHQSGTGPFLMVGFNRRFAPQIQKIKELLETVNEPKSFIMTMNAGVIPADHWTQDRKIGGGRIIGEACHYIDLMRFLAGSKITSVQAKCMGRDSGVDIADDKAAIILGFADGSFGTINYLANGNKNFPKERIEIFAAGRVLQLDNFRRLKAFGWPGFQKMNLWRQDKGQRSCPGVFLQGIENGGPSPISAQEIFEVAKASLEAARQLRGQ